MGKYEVGEGDGQQVGRPDGALDRSCLGDLSATRGCAECVGIGGGVGVRQVGGTEWAADSWPEPPPTCGHMPHFCLCPWQAGVGVGSLTEDSKCSEPRLPTGNEGHRLVQEQSGGLDLSSENRAGLQRVSQEGVKGPPCEWPGISSVWSGDWVKGPGPRTLRHSPDHRALEGTWGRDKAGPGAHSLLIQKSPLKVRKMSNLLVSLCWSLISILGKAKFETHGLMVYF